MAKRTIKIKDLEIQVERINESEYISLTDIAQQSDKEESKYLIVNWLKNHNTIDFLCEWELVHADEGEDIASKVVQMHNFKLKYKENRTVLTVKRYVEELQAKGIIAKAGRYGGTYAHPDIALNFCYWVSPILQVYLLKDYLRLKGEEFNRQGLEFHVKKITDSIDEARNWLDTIPGQHPNRNRLKFLKGEEGE